MTVGVVGSGSLADRTAALLDETAAETVVGEPDAVLDANPRVVVAVGEPALLALVRGDVSCPVLPVDAGRGVRSVPRNAIESAVRRVAVDEFATRERDLLDVSVDGSRYSVLMDAMLTTTEPADISEFGVEYTGESGRAVPVARFRADGVVVASPAGSHGYARRAGGPVLAPGSGTVAVLPVAPFAIEHTHWVLDLPLGLRVEREEAAVSMLADDRDLGELPPRAAVTVECGSTLTVAVVAESLPFFDGP